MNLTKFGILLCLLFLMGQSQCSAQGESQGGQRGKRGGQQQGERPGGHGDAVMTKWNKMKDAFGSMLDEGYNVAEAEDLIIEAQLTFEKGDRKGAGRLLDQAIVLLKELQKRPPTLTPEHIELGRQVTPLEIPTFAWSVAAARLTGASGQVTVLVGGIDGALYALRYPSMEQAWKVELPGLPYRLAVGDVDGDGTQEIACVALGSKGTLVLVDAKGREKWRFERDDLILSAAIGRGMVLAGGGARVYELDVAGKLVAAHSIGRSIIGSVDVGDLDGDGQDEIVVTNQNEGLYVANRRGKLLWSAIGHVGGMKIAAFGGIVKRSTPGRKSVFINKTRGVVKLYDSEGKAEWLYTSRAPEVIYGRPITVKTLAADLVGDAAEEIVCIGGQRFRNPRHSMLFVVNKDGREVFKTPLPFAPLGMARLDLDGDGKDEILLSSQEEKRLYTVGLGTKERDNVAALRTINPVDANLDAIFAKVQALPDARSRAKGGAPFHAIYEVRLTGPGDAREIQNLWRFLRGKSGGALRFELGLREVQEEGIDVLKPKSRVTTLSTREILQIAKRLGEARIPFYWGAASHTDQIFIKPETIAKMAEVAGESFLGCFSYETCFALGSGRRRQRYLDFLEKAVSVCAKHDKKYLISEPYDTWLFLPANKTFFEKILKQHPDTVVPIYKGNEGRCPDLAIGSIVGLYRQGLVGGWGVSVQDDMYRLGCYTDLVFQCPPDVKLRLDLACAALGATYMRIEWQTETDNYASKDPESFDYTAKAPFQLNKHAGRHRELFYALIRKGVIQAAAPEAIASLAPVPVILEPVPDDFSFSAKRAVYETQRGFINRWQYPLQRPYPECFSAYLYDLDFYGLGFFPRNPYGTVTVVPYHGLRRSQKPALITDGHQVLLEGERFSSLEAKPKVEALFASAASQLPFRTKDAFLAAHKRSDTEYLLTLLDPEPFRPEEVECELEINLPGRDWDLVDRITGETIEYRQGRATLRIPAGAFRLIKVTAR